MRYSIIVFTLIFPVLLQAQFDGTIKMRTINAEINEEANVIWQLDDGKHLMSFETSSDGKSMEYQLLILDDKKELWFLSDQPSKSAYSIPFNSLEKRNLSIPLNSLVKDTERKEKMLGVDCSVYEIITESGRLTCWVTTMIDISPNDFPSFMRNGALMGVLKLNGIKGIPLKYELRDLDGNILNAQYIKSIGSGVIPPSTFMIPSTYTKNPGQKND